MRAPKARPNLAVKMFVINLSKRRYYQVLAFANQYVLVHKTHSIEKHFLSLT